ncbi:hypothetical protein BDV96DRAFT_566118 [Lophiotrema nucula]|uniref:Uncharacterized protein n=1 Tax=Lophiotrema nucula TaxID=690887 RepID=A0A6A5ZNL8_9PLEO|nr:hypothetical protein BDV96DRAFT_566118 [Lophiotrema nucula]
MPKLLTRSLYACRTQKRRISTVSGSFLESLCSLTMHTYSPTANPTCTILFPTLATFQHSIASKKEDSRDSNGEPTSTRNPRTRITCRPICLDARRRIRIRNEFHQIRLIDSITSKSRSPKPEQCRERDNVENGEKPAGTGEAGEGLAAVDEDDGREDGVEERPCCVCLRLRMPS